MKYLLAFLLIVPCFTYGQKTDPSKFIAHGKSLIQFYGYERAIQRNEEIVSLYFALDSKDWKADRALVKQAIDEERKLKLQIQTDRSDPRYAALKKQTLEIMDIIIQCFSDLYEYGPESEQFKKSNEVYQPMLSAHLKTFFSFFDDDSYFKIDSVKTLEYRAKAYSVAFPQKEELSKLLTEKKYLQAYDLLQGDKANFDRDVALLHMADLLLKKKYHEGMDGKVPNADSLAPVYLYKIMSRNAYTPFLYEGWRKWRAITQIYEHGASKTSDIPNDLYDQHRFRLMKVVLLYIEKNPADIWAYVQFFGLQNAEIIQRFGPYEYGNQSALERQELFYKD